MRLVQVALENFRGYGAHTVLEVDDLTVLVGRNDAGKSTFLDALDIVLGDGKIDASDIHVRAYDSDEVCIECAFDDLPDGLTIDAGSRTSLSDEYLVDEKGHLRLRWSYSVGGKAGARTIGKALVRVVAHHPSKDGIADLHGKKNSDLKKLVKDAGVEARCDLNNNASMRAVLWADAREKGDWDLQERLIDLSKEDGKSILGQVVAALPIYALFRADRPSTDQDAEVQDPMKVAVRTALEEMSAEIEAMKARVKEKALEVADRTINSLRDFDATLASSLKAEFPDPKLETSFKLALVGDDGIAVNKRGSGVRRLVVFSFFWAEAGRKHEDANSRGIIYAVEEPETAQHPHFQRMVVQALRDLATSDGHQVILTTHSPGLAGLLPTTSLRLVRKSHQGALVEPPSDSTLDAIASELGVLSEYTSRDEKPGVLVMLEGPNDVAVMTRFASLWATAGRPAPSHGANCVFVPAGGQDLRNWVEHRYLSSLGLREVHIYDRDPTSKTDPTPKYQAEVANVNRRGDGSCAFLTSKQAMENYLHWGAVEDAARAELGIEISIDPWDDTDNVVERCTAVLRGSSLPCNCKAWINRHAVNFLTLEHIRERNAEDEVSRWFSAILNPPADASLKG